MNISHAKTPLAVLWDFGGVILSSPFEAFNRYETEIGLPKDFIRSLNARNGDTNAWAKMERSEVSLEGFVALFEEEARQQGYKLDGWRILQSLSGDIRPQMVEALRRNRCLVYFLFRRDALARIATSSPPGIRSVGSSSAIAGETACTGLSARCGYAT